MLRQGRPAHVAYDTAFFISWPEHLGGGTVELVLRVKNLAREVSGVQHLKQLVDLLAE